MDGCVGAVLLYAETHDGIFDTAERAGRIQTTYILCPSILSLGVIIVVSNSIIISSSSESSPLSEYFCLFVPYRPYRSLALLLVLSDLHLSLALQETNMSNMEMHPPPAHSPRASSEAFLHEGQTHARGPMIASAQLTNNMDAHDLENPHNWPPHRKFYTSFACWCMAASV